MLKVVLQTQNLENTNNRKFAKLKINNATVRFQLNTGSNITSSLIQ